MKTNQLTKWAINKIKTEYPDDVALLIGLEGHSVNNDGHGECFDYFVPATERGNQLSQTFIINGIGHDLYPRSWERIERTASLDDTATLTLGNAQILYSRTKEDEERFLALKSQLNENLRDKAFVYRKALENLNIAMDLYRTMMFEDRLYKVRMSLGFIHHYLSLSVTFLNGTYSKDWREGVIPELAKLNELPNNFTAYYRSILMAKGVSDLKSLAHLLISDTRSFIAQHKPTQLNPPHNTDFTGLANWYQELSLTWRRLRYYCDTQNLDAAFVDSCNLQNELNIMGEEFGLKEMDLMGSFDFADLTLLHKRSTELEKYIVAEIESHGVKIKSYETIEEFLSHS